MNMREKVRKGKSEEDMQSNRKAEKHSFLSALLPFSPSPCLPFFPALAKIATNALQA